MTTDIQQEFDKNEKTFCATCAHIIPVYIWGDQLSACDSMCGAVERKEDKVTVDPVTGKETVTYKQNLQYEREGFPGDKKNRHPKCSYVNHRLDNGINCPLYKKMVALSAPAPQ